MSQVVESGGCFVVTEPDGSFSVYKDKNCTILHNPSGPAIKSANGDRFYYIDGKRHRDDLPAIEYANGDWTYYKNGRLHRDGGPAHKNRDNQYWYKDGHLHREDGPASENKSIGLADYYLNGIWYPKSRWSSVVKVKEEENPIAYRETNRIVYKNKNGQYHRLDGPAIVYDSGTQYWYKNALLHNPNGPAISHSTGLKEYYLNGMRHRADGPAYVGTGVAKVRSEYWYEGRKYGKAAFVAKFMTPAAPADPAPKALSLPEMLNQAKRKVATQNLSDGYMSSEKMAFFDGYMSSEKCATPYMNTYVEVKSVMKKQTLQEKLKKNLEEGTYMALGIKP